MRKQPSKGSSKIELREISQNSQEIYAGISFFIKLLTLQICCFIKNKLVQVFSCEFCEICKNTFFAEHHRTTASYFSSINGDEGLANETVNYDTKLKHMYQFEPEVQVIKKYLRTPILTEQLQWLLLTFNKYFQRIPEQKPVRLLKISTRFS